MSVSRHRVLMCPPQFYSIRYEINPWMSVKNQANKALAVQQWKTLRRTFAKYEIQVEEVKPGPRLPDMVFTANGGVVSGKTFIPSNFRFPSASGRTGPLHQLFQAPEIPRGGTGAEPAF